MIQKATGSIPTSLGSLHASCPQAHPLPPTVHRRACQTKRQHSVVAVNVVCLSMAALCPAAQRTQH